MKIVLEHLRSQTIPHDMIEELNTAGVRYYEGARYIVDIAKRCTNPFLGCLIVQVQDHRKPAADSKASSASKANDKNVPFSIHNYNEHLTPSPFVPYPKSPSTNDDTTKPDTNAEAGIGENGSTQETSAPQKLPAKRPKIFTTVLLPTPRLMEEELLIMANTPDPRAVNRKQSQAGATSRTPASATMPHPPTPLSALPPTPTTGPQNKKQKMQLGESDIRPCQSKIMSATAPPLYLDPVDSLQEASKLIQSLTDLLHKGDLPSPKTRKRTVAELEADEAQAASEQRFMLIMDERLGNSVAGTKASGADGEVGAAPFEARFERFTTIENIRATHREKEQQEQERKAITQAHNKHKQEQAELRQMHEKKAAEMAHKQEHMRMQHAINAQQQKAAFAAKQQQATNQNPHGHGPTANGVMPNQQHMPSNTQPPQSSPIARNITPHSNPRSSPLVGNVPPTVPMNVTPSGQGVTSSPARPTSAAQHGHPMGGVAMAPNRSQQRPPSRIGTPSMPNGTPSMQHGTPVMKQATPTPRMNQGSPPHPMIHTPMMTANGMAAQHINMGQLNPEQLRNIQQYRIDQQRIAHLRQQEAMANNMSPNNGMSPMGPQNPSLQQLAAQNQQMRNYQAQQHEYARQMNGGGAGGPSHMMPSATPNPHARAMPPQPPHRPQNPQQMNQQQQNAARVQFSYQQQALSGLAKQLVQQYGGQESVPQEKMVEARNKAIIMAKQYMMKHAHARQQQMMQAQMAGAGGGMNGGGPGLGMAGMGGMNGVNGMNGMGGMEGMGGMNGMQ